MLGGQLNDRSSDILWEDIIKDVDINGDGMISLDEFTDMMLKYIK